MTDIQQARDVLAKWRENGTTGRWEATTDGYVALPTAPISSFIDVASHEEVAPLIVGTAGNPDLLDAIDGILDHAAWVVQGFGSGVASPSADRIAAAIIAADERMTS